MEEIYTYLISSTKSFQFVKSSNDNTPTRSSQENTLGEAAHNEHTTFTYIAVKSMPFAHLFPCAYLAKTVNHRFFSAKIFGHFKNVFKAQGHHGNIQSLLNKKKGWKSMSQDENS